MRLILALLVGAAAPAALSAQAVDATLKQERPGLLAQARVTPDSARAIARRTVPGATIQSAEIENEDHKLIYSFDMKVPGKSGIEEVNVDALTGAVIGRQHEDARTEANEATNEHRDVAREHHTADTTLKQESPGLLAQARVTPDAARAIARRTVPGATIQSSELENEDHKLIYSFDMKVAGESGIEEVNIDALTGAVVGREHEDARSEANEESHEHRAPRPRARPAPAPTTPPARNP